MGVADLRPAVPSPHGVDGLGQLRAATFVNTARVNPDVAVAVPPRAVTAADDLPVSLQLTQRFRIWVLHVFEEDLFLAPGM